MWPSVFMPLRPTFRVQCDEVQHQEREGQSARSRRRCTLACVARPAFRNTAARAIDWLRKIDCLGKEGTMAKPVLPITRRLPSAVEARAARDYDARLRAPRAPTRCSAVRAIKSTRR
jgi:hypothetical protein